MVSLISWPHFYRCLFTSCPSTSAWWGQTQRSRCWRRSPPVKTRPSQTSTAAGSLEESTFSASSTLTSFYPGGAGKDTSSDGESIRGRTQSASYWSKWKKYIEKAVNWTNSVQKGFFFPITDWRNISGHLRQNNLSKEYVGLSFIQIIIPLSRYWL